MRSSAPHSGDGRAHVGPGAQLCHAHADPCAQQRSAAEQPHRGVCPARGQGRGLQGRACHPLDPDQYGRARAETRPAQLAANGAVVFCFPRFLIPPALRRESAQTTSSVSTPTSLSATTLLGSTWTCSCIACVHRTSSTGPASAVCAAQCPWPQRHAKVGRARGEWPADESHRARAHNTQLAQAASRPWRPGRVHVRREGHRERPCPLRHVPVGTRTLMSRTVRNDGPMPRCHALTLLRAT